MVAMQDNSAAARRWRERWGYVGRGGVIVLFGGEVQSWVDALRNSDHWKPGCIAIDEEGKSWTTIAGNEQSDALIWLPEGQLTENSLPKIQTLDVGPTHRGFIDLAKRRPGTGMSFAVAPIKKSSGLSSLADRLFKRIGLS